MAERVNIKNLHQAETVKAGDYIILETSDGTKILDFKDFTIDTSHTSFANTFSGHTTDISVNYSLIQQLTGSSAANTTLVSQVSGLTGLMWRDTWSASTTYNVQDAVEYSNSSFVAIAGSTNEAPAAGEVLNSSYWNYLAKAGTVTLPLSTANALLSYNGTALTEIAPAAAGYTLKSKGSSSAPEWQLPDTGKPRAVCAQLGETYHDISASAPWETSLPFIMTDGTVRIGGDDSEIGHMSLGRAYDDTQVYQTPEQMLFDTRTFNYSADKIKQVYVSCYESYAVMSGGDVYHTGINNNGMGGDGSTTTRSLFRRIAYFSDNNLPIDRVFFQNDLNRYTDNYSTAYFLTTAGDLYAAGYNTHGQCGNGNTTSPQTTPVKVQNIGKDETPGKVEEVWTIQNSSAPTTYAKCADGKVYGWGYNGGYKLGDGTTTSRSSPIELPALSGTILMKGQNASSYYSSQWYTDALFGQTFALLSNGRLKMAGRDHHGYGIFGDDNTSDHYATVWTDVSGVSAWKDFDLMSDWYYSAVGLHEDGSVYGWGYNGSGNVDGLTTAEILTPMKLDNQVGCLSGSIDGKTWDIRGRIKRVIATKNPQGTAGQGVRSTILITDSNEIYSAGKSAYTSYTDMNNADIQVYLPLASNTHPNPETRGYQKWTLPCDPSEIKDIKTSCQNYYSYYYTYNVYILTNDGKVFVSGSTPPGCRPSVSTHGNYRYWSQVEF